MQPEPIVRVALISCVGEIGGAEVLLMETLEGLDRGRFLPSVIQLRPGPLEARARAAGMPVTVLPTHRMRNLLAVGLTVLRIRRVVRGQGISLLHSNAFRAHAYGGLAARLSGVPEVVTVHSPEPPGAFTRAILGIPSHAVMANCTATGDWFREHGWNPEVIWPGVHLGRLALHTPREELARRHGLDPARRWVAMCSRIQRHKGQDHFVRALAALPPDAGVLGLVVGAPLFGLDEDYFRELQALAAGLGLGPERLRFTGFVSDADVAGFQAASQLAVHSALKEDFGLAVAETMALETPVLAFASPGPAVIITPGTGWLVPVGDQPALDAALVAAVADPDECRRRGRAAHERVVSAFTIERHIAGVERCYRRVLSSASPRPGGT